jgi:hypothetical protein
MNRETLTKFILGASMTIAMSCGASSGPTASVPTASVQTSIGPVVLSDNGCTFGGPSQIGSGPVALKMTNQTNGHFNLDLWKLDEGHSYGELDAHIKEEQRRAAAGEPELGHPTFAALIRQESVASGTEVKNIPRLTPGTYGFVCIALANSGPGAIWLAGPLTVVG